MTAIKLPRAKASTDPAGNRHVKTDETQMVLREGRGMKAARRTPCAECPLRRDSIPGYLGGWSPEMYLRAMHSDVSLACHSSKGFHEGVIETQHVCTGVAAYRANVGHVCFSTAHDSTVAIGEDREHYFGSPEEFYNHHKPGQAPQGEPSLRVWRVTKGFKHGRSVIARTATRAVELYRAHMSPRFPNTTQFFATDEGNDPRWLGEQKTALLSEGREGVIVQRANPAATISQPYRVWEWA